MKKIGITGNIASGKTTVEDIIKQKGFKVLDSDNLCHQALENNQNIINNVIKAFSDFNITDEFGKINRRALGEIIFSDNEYKNKLEKILHPYVNKKIKEFFSLNIGEDVIFVSIPLLYETAMHKLFDKIILVCADEDVRLKRLISRNNFTEEHALSRMKSQMPQDGKVKLADFIIDNNGNLNSLINQTEQVISKIL